MAELSELRIEANGVQFSCRSAGEPGTPLALCLHGFPDSAHTYRLLLPELAAAGFHAVAPFMRGYAPTSVAADGRYQSGVLVLDANELHAALGADGNAVIIGHDWGAPAAGGAAVIEPWRWSKVVTMAVPPGGVVRQALLTDTAQLKLSWYMFFFQHWLADVIVPADDMAFIDMLWNDWSPGYDATVDLAHVKACLADQSNLGAALGYYRANLGDGHRDPALDAAQEATHSFPSQPHLYLHGTDDGCIRVEVAEAARAAAPTNLAVEVVERCGHFLHLERPDVVNQRIIEFLR